VIVLKKNFIVVIVNDVMTVATNGKNTEEWVWLRKDTQLVLIEHGMQ